MTVTWLALARRDLLRYFKNPTGYVFVLLFVLLSSAAAFLRPGFFANNLADLSQLDELMPYLLLFFIPALTMSSWSDERKQGTDEILLTLPASDWELVIGKYLSTLAIFTLALTVSLSHVAVLFWLGRPDVGQLVASYLGSWLMGASLIPLGLLGSFLTSNAAIAFVLGALFCAAPVALRQAATLLGERVGNALGRFGFTVYADDFARGIVSADATAYFVLLAAVCLLVNVLLLDRRHWQPRDQDWPMSVHLTLRALAAIVAAGACIVLASRVHARLDLTAERLYTLSDETAALLAAVPAERPVIVQAFISPSVPTPLVQTQKNLLGMLREIEARSGGRVTVAMQMTEPFSPAARLAQDRFNIAPRSVVDPQTGATTTDLYLGVAVSAGGDEDVVPFFEPSLSPEYELARAIRVVSRARRKRVGIIDTDVKLLGGFDYQRNRPRVAWTVVRELKKQYEVVEVTPADAPTTDVDVLVLVLPSRMTQTDLDVAFEPVRRGVPTLLLLDPLPMFDMRLAPAADLASEIDPFQPSPPARVVFGDIRAALTELGINWVPAQVAWDAYNPHPTLRALPPENVFVSTGNGNAQAVAARDQATSGLNEVFLPFPGYLLPAGDDTTFEPLLQTGPQSGLLSFFDLVQPSPQGLALGGSVTHAPENRSLVLAARVRAKTTNTDENPRPVNVVAVADLDFISDAFFELGASTPDTSFDNATFFLNAVDTLAGDDVFIALRRHRARHRTLDRLDRQVRGFADQRVREEQAAEREAQTALTQAQERMQQRVDQVNQRQDLDALTKQMTVAALVETENRSLTQLAKAIDQTKSAKIRASREAMESAVRGIQQRIRLAALLLPPVPVLLAAAGTWLQRRRRDRDIARLSGRSAAPS